MVAETPWSFPGLVQADPSPAKFFRVRFQPCGPRTSSQEARALKSSPGRSSPSNDLAQPQLEESPDQIGWLEYLLGAQLGAGIALMGLGRRGQAMRSFHDAQQSCLRFFDYTGRYASGRLFGLVLSVLRGYLWLEDQRWYQAISRLRLATEGLRSLARLGRAEDKPKQLEAKPPKP